MLRTAAAVVGLALVLATPEAQACDSATACPRGGHGAQMDSYHQRWQPSAALTSAYVEVDPVLFGLSGFGVQAGLRPYGYLDIGAGAFMLDSPDFAVEDGWTQSVRGGNLAFGIHCGPRGGFSTGLAIVVMQSEWGHVDSANTTLTRTEVSAAPYLSFQWFPLSRAGLYVRPVAMIGVDVVRLGDEPEIAGHTLDESRLFHHLALHLGWQFGGNPPAAPAPAAQGS